MRFERHRSVRSVKQGSALLVAILVMGVLLTLTLGLSTLVVREIRQTADIVAAGQAYFAAEAAMENALYDLAENLPGYEVVDKIYPPPGVEDDYLNYAYTIGNKGDKYPYFPEDEPVFLSPDIAVPSSVLYENHPQRTYNVLPLNESVTIPLFTANDDGTVNDIDDFLVEYYVNFDLADVTKFQPLFQNSNGQPLKLEDFDIMRWKVFGNPCNNDCSHPDTLKTDAISDFYPAVTGVSAERPVCIGTVQALSDFGEGCSAPVAEEVKYGNNSEVTKLDLNGKGFSFARECFLSEVTDPTVGSQKGEAILRKCTINQFIQTHSRNYVTLTNMVNPDIIGINPETTPQYANIYYRIVTSGGEDNSIVREYADIKADGFSREGSVQQSINAKLRMSSFLPVFNFSLYRTDTSSDENDSPFRSMPGLLQRNSLTPAFSTIQ